MSVKNGHFRRTNFEANDRLSREQRYCPTTGSACEFISIKSSRTTVSNAIQTSTHVKIFAQLPSWLWDELVDAVNRVDAALPVKDNPGGAPPDAMITSKRPSASHFKVIGCLCFVHKPASTMEAKGVQGSVVGYAKNSVGLRVLIAKAHYKDRHAIVESNSVICHEGLRGINGTFFDGNIIITTTDGFDNFGL